MSSTPNDGYALVPSTTMLELPPPENPSAVRGTKKSITATLAVMAGLCFMGASLAIATRSQYRSHRSLAFANQPQQSIIVRDELEAEIVTIPVIIRDFEASHPDFECDLSKFPQFNGKQPTLGIVADKLGDDGKPVYNGAITVESKSTFDQWYRDVPGVNTPVQVNLNLTRQPNGHLEATHNEFFPIDFRGNLHPLHKHNFWFTMEMHTVFRYHGGEIFTFDGDDDLWIFINGSLAIDLGGMHEALKQSVNLDTLGLNKGEVASLDLFFAERHTVESHFKVDTTIDFNEDLCTDHEHMLLGTVPHNNLGGPEGLVFHGTGVVPNEPKQQVELAISVKKGSAYSPGGKQNGKFGEYGIISVKADSNVTLEFTFRDPDSKKPVIQKKSYLSFLDLDAASRGSSSESVEVGGFTTKVLMPQTELVQAAAGSGRTRFSATAVGTIHDNPRDPNLLTVAQKMRVVTLAFEKKSAIEATLSCSAGSMPCDFIFAASPSLLCAHSVGSTPEPPATQTATTTMTTTTVTTLESIKFCVIDIDAFNIHLICFPEKQWWMFWK